MIELALSNLIDDACNYPDSATEVRIVTHVELSGFGESCVVIFEIMSQSPSLIADESTTVFDKYWRRGWEKGVACAGLGSHLVHVIARDHGGRFSAKTRPDRSAVDLFSMAVQLQPNGA